MAKSSRTTRSSGATAKNPVVFPVDQIRELAELMEKHDLSEINLRSADHHWRIRRGAAFVASDALAGALPAASVASPAPATPPPSTSAETGPPAAAESKKDEEGVFIKSPTVGTFYAAPSPEDPPFVTVGSHVEPDTIVCIIEAMKVFNQIPAEVRGTIVEVLVENGQPVEYNQPLFRVRPD